MVWASLPCTAWCPWQAINVRRGLVAAVKIYLQRQASAVMIDLWMQLLGWCMAEKAWGKQIFMAFEWPKQALGWQLELLKAACEALPVVCLFDGCMYGLVDAAGLRLRKPWRVITNHPGLLEPLSQSCSHDHTHGCVHGADAIRSGLYTSKLVEAIGLSLIHI